MTQKEILELFNWAIEEYKLINKEYVKERYGYFIAITDIFQQITNYEKGEKNE